MDDDWDVDDETPKSGSSTPAAPVAPPRAPARGKFAGEDEDEEEDDWDAPSEDEKPKPAAAPVAAPSKKKKTLKQVLAEKELAKKTNGDDDDLMDTMTTQERRRLAREKELEADMAVAAELMGGMAGPSMEDNKEALAAVLGANPTSKDDFATLAKQIITVAITRHESNPLFPAFAEQLAKELCESLNAQQTRKVSSSLSVLGNTKQQDERDKASGKKKAATKPKLGANKVINKVDTEAYEDVLEDDDFM